MVGPLSGEERDAFAVKLKIALVAVVAASGGLMAIHGGASLPVVAAAVLGGLVVGVLLVRIVFPETGESMTATERRGRR